ncbi:hypothetical protein HQ487_04165 [Candidatus Uhrbacteria bacterium]|nr:hypothetical protein [Candidatus Uhrbacteria bacterium]
MDIQDKIIEALVEIKSDIKEIKSDLASKPSKDEVLGGFDEQQVVLQRLDQERIFTLERIKRIEADVEHMKKILQIA